MFIYGLFDSSGELRYIGQTTKPVDERLMEHLWPSALKKHGHKNHWIKELLNKGESPYIQCFQTLNTIEDLDAAETYWIEFFKNQGCRLTNSTGGGEGLKNPSSEVRARMSAAKKGKPSSRKGIKMSDSTKEKLRQANLGKKASEESKAKMAKSHKERNVVLSSEQIEKLRASRLGWKASPEQRENMRKAAQKRVADKKQQQSSQQ